MSEPIAVALREIVETRRLIEQLVESSESFNYQKAKEALKTLERKRRALLKLEQELAADLPKARNIEVLDFRGAKTSPTASL